MLHEVRAGTLLEASGAERNRNKHTKMLNIFTGAAVKCACMNLDHTLLLANGETLYNYNRQRVSSI